MVRKVCVVTGYRSDYSKLKSVLDEISSRDDLELQLVVGAVHLLDDYGLTIDYIRRDGFRIDAVINNVVEGENLSSMSKSVGLGVIDITTVLGMLRPDIVLIVGDRFEIFSAAIASALLNIPLAHIQGGEVTGTIDESIRHSITKLAHIHFPSTKESYDRIISLGEKECNVFLVGCPAVDEILKVNVSDKNDLLKIPFLNKLDINKPYLLVVQHPVTTEFGEGYDQMMITLNAVQEIGLQVVLLYPNPDAGSTDFINAINQFDKDNVSNVIVKKFKHLPFNDYIRLLANASCMVGNSSSGIREACLFGVPVINIGSREASREKSDNVINVGYNKKMIVNNIKKELGKKYKPNKLYGDGTAAKKICDVLSSIELKGIAQKRLEDKK